VCPRVVASGFAAGGACAQRSAGRKVAKRRYNIGYGLPGADIEAPEGPIYVRLHVGIEFATGLPTIWRSRRAAPGKAVPAWLFAPPGPRRLGGGSLFNVPANPYFTTDYPFSDRFAVPAPAQIRSLFCGGTARSSGSQ